MSTLAVNDWLRFFLIVVGAIVIIYVLNIDGYRLRKMQSKAPDDLVAIMHGLPEAWRLISYEWRGRDWKAEVGFGERHFHISTDYGYPHPIDVTEIIDEEPPILSPSTTYRYRAVGSSPVAIREQLAELTRTET